MYKDEYFYMYFWNMYFFNCVHRIRIGNRGQESQDDGRGLELRVFRKEIRS